VVAEPAVRVAFLRGAYLASDADATAELLRVLAWAVPGWSLYTVGAKALQAAERTWLSAGLGLATLVPSWFVYQALAQTDGVLGLATATVVCVTTASVLTLSFLRSTYGIAPWRPLLLGCAEGALLGAAGACGATGVTAILSLNASWGALAGQGISFAATALLLAVALPGSSGDLIRTRILRRR
jgi:peptidoglycan biosynthesis protein MviN/MurJ (putative lipid II flippase)